MTALDLETINELLMETEQPIAIQMVDGRLVVAILTELPDELVDTIVTE